MTQLIKSSALAIFAFSMTACSSDPAAPEENVVTETRMDEVDVIDGTISDDMVDVDAVKTGDDMVEEDKSADETSDNESDDTDDETDQSSETEE
ncbi:MAG: hypothetical protein V7676_09800 [Parasphingorhabdus sp.]|uniref:hypothetical protein n=1 Tax=Parasphingorhabdus sp. TaxID=2709688 RepID=UPI003002BB44